MGDIFLLLIFLSILIERVTEKILYLLPRSKRVFSWIVSTVLALLVTFFFRIGLLNMIGLAADSAAASFFDYVVTALLISSGTEPIHALFQALEYKKDEIKKKAKV